MKDFIKRHYPKIQELIDTIMVGVFVCDAKGNVIAVNKESDKTGGVDRNLLLGRNMKELKAEGWVKESATLLTIESGKSENIIQSLGSGEKIFITSIPIYHNDKLELIVCTEIDVTEASDLRDLLKEQKEITKKYKDQIELYRNHRYYKPDEIITESNQIKSIVASAKRIANRNVSVFITGESGTGKELIANIIHKNSNRANKPFIKINCTAIPDKLIESELFGYVHGAFTGANEAGKKGVFEAADGGTLFLDEIGDMNVKMQSKLLRVLQDKELVRLGDDQVRKIDVRIISATNIDIGKSIANNRFREDLYYRLNVMEIHIPPLRERMSDIEMLAEYFVSQFNKVHNLDKVLLPDAIVSLKSYDWPGNVRELKNIIERTMLSFDGDEISYFQISQQLALNDPRKDYIQSRYGKGTLSERMEAFEKDLLMELLNEHGKCNKVAESLGVNKSTISKKLKKYEIDYKSMNQLDVSSN